MTAVSVSMTHAAWLVDLDGTLYFARGVRLAMGAELALFGGRAIRTIREFRRQHELMRDELRAGDRTAEDRDPSLGSAYQRQLQRTASELGLEHAQVARLVDHWMVSRPGKWLRLFRRRALIDEIARFRAGGGRTAIVSDYPARGKLAALGVTELFDVVVSNGETEHVTALKPAPDGYLYAARLLGVEPRQCLVIGDRDDADGEAAKSANMTFRKV